MHETIEALSAYVDDEVSAAERARIDAHLAACADCASRKALLERASVSLSTLPAVSPTAEESRSIRQGVLGRTRRRSRFPLRLHPVWAGAGALALVVAGVVAGSGLLNNHPRPETTMARRGSSASQAAAPVFDNPADLRSFVSTDSGVKQAFEALSAPAPSGGGAPKAAPQVPDALQYGTNSVPGAPAPGKAGSRNASPPKATADSSQRELAKAAPERSAVDCLAERQHDQPNIRPILTRPATYTGKPAWLLVYAAPAPSPGAPEELAAYLVGRADCGLLTSQVVAAP